MKKFLTVVFTLLLAGSLSFAQTGGSTGGATDKPVKTQASGKKATKSSKKGKKGGKKSKKGTTDTTTPPK